MDQSNTERKPPQDSTDTWQSIQKQQSEIYRKSEKKNQISSENDTLFKKITTTMEILLISAMITNDKKSSWKNV